MEVIGMSTWDNPFDALGPIQLQVESLAPPTVLSRALQHHAALELTDDQLRRLLAIARKYHDEFIRIAVDFVNVGTELDLAYGQAPSRRIARLLDRHAALFREHEDLLRQACEDAARILKPGQTRRLMQIHSEQRQRTIRRLLPSLRRALGPGFKSAAPRRGKAKTRRGSKVKPR